MSRSELAGTVEAVIFDVNETLIDLGGLVPAFQAVGLSATDVSVWLTRTQRDGFALGAAGQWASFRDVGVAVWRQMAKGSSGDHLLNALANCHLHSDVAPAVIALCDLGIPMATLSIGGVATARDAFARAGLAIDAHLSCDAVERWKPAPEPYRYAADQLGVRPNQAVMIAAHDWDLNGAHATGLRTGWVNRRNRAWSPVFVEPDFTMRSLHSVADLAGLPSR